MRLTGEKAGMSPFGSRKSFFRALAAVVAALLFLGGPTAYRFWIAHRDLDQAIAETDRLDPGWRFQDLEAERRIPPADENSALQVLAVDALLPRPWPTPPANPNDEDSYVLQALPPERRLEDRHARLVRADLQRAGPALGQARKLADMPTGRYAVTWSADVISTTCPWSNALFSVKDLLLLDAFLRNHDEQPDEALLSIRALLNLGRSVGDEPFWYGRNSCRFHVSWAMERTLGQGRPSEEALAAMQEAIVREEAVPLLANYFRGERATTHVFMTRVENGQNRLSEWSCVPTRGFDATKETYLGRLNALRVHARFLHGINTLVQIAQLPVEQQWPRYQEFRQQHGRVDDVGSGQPFGPRETGFILGHAWLRCTVAALASERYRCKTGHWPRALADLVPDYLPVVPLDPFDNEPLRYRRTETGAVISSIGPESPVDQGRRVEFTLWNVDQRRQPPKAAPPILP